MSDVRVALTELAAALAAPEEELVIAAEGNLSAAHGDRLLVSPSGYRLREIDPADWVPIRFRELAAVLDERHDDAAWLERILASRDDEAAPRPTVEVALHAVIAAELGDGFIAHTHPTSLLSILCSAAVEEHARARYFPDHAVLLGPADCVVPYVDPGQELARVTRDAVRGHLDRYGEAPRLILAANHGVFVQGSSPAEVLDRTRMAVKVARLVLGAAPLGGAVPMPEAQVDRILGREDEHFRRRLLAGA